MDFRIRNSYIKKFLSNYTNQNELKIIKYLVIIAIRSLEKMSKEKFTYSELKNQAKEIMKSVPKEDKQLNKELKIIKDELAKLNEKFQDKFKAPSPQKQQQQTFKEPAKQEPNYPRSTSAPRNYDPKTLTRKAPSTWREGDKMTFEEAEKERRANSNEPVPQQDWNKTRQRGHHVIPSITLKPNEIPFPRVNPRDNINHVTKHHLDDTEAVNAGSKKVMNEEGVVYFPERDKENNKRLHNQTKQSQKTRTSHKAKQETRVADDSKHSPAIRYSMTRDQYEEENQDEVTPRSEAGEVHKSKSPQFQSRGNLQRDLKYRQEEDYELRHPVAQDTFGPGYRGGEHREDRKAKTQKTQKPTHDKSKNRSTKLSRSRLNQTQLEPQREYGDVESKIKDDVNYHKEISRQYKKMKTNMRQYDSQMEEDLSASSSQRYSNHPEKFEFVAPKEAGYRHRQSQDSSRYQSAYYNNSHLLESASSVAKSLNMQRSPNHLLERTGDYNMSATRHRRTENARNEDGSYYKSIAGENQGGILDIANSFLNSPLMQHLSNIDSRHSEDDSSKASSSQGEHSKRHVSNVRVTTFDSKSPSLFPKSPAKRYEGVDESRRLEPHSSQNLRPISHQHKYSDWVGVYKPDNVKTHQSIVLKDSDNKRYADYGSKDSRMFGDKDDTSSMTSSAFSNFLNDEMKVFFRKETYELKKNKNSKSMLRHDDSEISSNNTSFPRNEMNRTVSGGPSHSRRITNQHYYDNNKSYNGLPLDNVNIFHNERLSVTRVLNS